MMPDGFDTLGWAVFEPNNAVKAWADHAEPIGWQRADNIADYPHWKRSGGTWFVGADVLGNDADGRLPNGPSLTGPAIEACQHIMPDLADWGPGQVSICYPNYPLQDEGESDANHRYRINRDAAHLDGLKLGANRRRFMEEFHGFILGIPLNKTPRKASPFVIWDGSHLILLDMLKTALGQIDPADWHRQDLTDIYTETRRQIFADCTRREIHVEPGQAYIAHRFSLHGVAPWRAGPHHKGRSIAYFRPFWGADRTSWLTA